MRSGRFAAVAHGIGRGLARELGRLGFGNGAALGLVGLSLVALPAVPGELIAYGRRIALQRGQSDVLYTAEGRNTSIAVTRWKSDGAVQLIQFDRANGVLRGGTDPRPGGLALGY